MYRFYTLSARHSRCLCNTWRRASPSAATAAVIDIKPTMSVTVTGVAQEGQTLMATAIANDVDAIINYQWFDSDNL